MKTHPPRLPMLVLLTTLALGPLFSGFADDFNRHDLELLLVPGDTLRAKVTFRSEWESNFCVRCADDDSLIKHWNNLAGGGGLLEWRNESRVPVLVYFVACHKSGSGAELAWEYSSPKLFASDATPAQPAAQNLAMGWEEGRDKSFADVFVQASVSKSPPPAETSPAASATDPKTPPKPPVVIDAKSGAIETHTWRQGEPPVRLIRKEEGFCALSLVTGHFQGGGEVVQLYVGDDGYWYLGGESAQEGVAAECIVVRYREPR